MPPSSLPEKAARPAPPSSGRGVTPLFVGIDPGASGGIAVIRGDTLTTYPMPKFEAGVWSTLRTVIEEDDDVIAGLEKVTGHVGGGKRCPLCKQARNKSPGGAMFNFGQGVGGIRMALIALGLRPNLNPVPGAILDLPPQRWQGGLGIDPRRDGETDTQWKNRLKYNAQRFYPDLKLTLLTADAVLIVTYLKMLYEGEVS